MDHDKFLKILNTFVDPGTNIERTKGKLLVQVRDIATYIEVFQKHGELYVHDQDDVEFSATNWLLNRIARLPLLADRILTQIPAVPNFVIPGGKLNDQTREDATNGDQEIDNALKTTSEFLSIRPSFTSSVLYLTSDAGEGKTSLITQLARQQAEHYKAGTTDWLLVPIELGGRPFIRFDDIVVGYLTNRLRFPVFYYDAFLELVKLGVIIPAFDGFEEMFVQSQSGDAISAVGNLMSSLNEQGTILISARKAYYEYQDLRLRSKLFDSVNGRSVTFSRLQLARWNRIHFLLYAQSRNVSNAGLIYDEVLRKVADPDHPLLTRAVLVRRLLDVAEKETDLASLLAKLSESPQSFFSLFVQAIIDREAQTKWIDQGGDAAKPLLTVSEHLELLSMVAQEMWLLSTEAIHTDVLETIAEVFSEAKRKSPSDTRQIRERIKQHALLTSHETVRSSYMFDHEEFRNFFLGTALARILLEERATSQTDALSILRQGSLAYLTTEALVSHVRLQPSGNVEKLIERLNSIARIDSLTSFTHENCSCIILRLAASSMHAELTLEGLIIPQNCLHAIRLSDLHFKKCEFASTDTENSSLTRVTFTDCNFDRLGLSQSLQITDAKIENCNFKSITPPNRDIAIFTPAHFNPILTSKGFQVTGIATTSASQSQIPMPEDDYTAVLKLVRIFSAKTFITDVLIRTKFGKTGSFVIDQLLPILLKNDVLVETTYRGKGIQRLFKLGRPMEDIISALEKADGKLANFLAILANRK